MAFYKPEEIKEISVNAGAAKANSTLLKMLILGFFGGAFIAFGFLLDIRVMGTMPAEWGSFATFIGAAVFPIGLVLVLLAGADLITGNMMTVAMALFDRKIGFGKLIYNWVIVTLANLVGALFIAFFFGHFLGLTEGDFAAKTMAIATGKADATFLQTFVSGIGCNWLVCLAVWLCFGAQDFVGKILGIWFPVMAFVTIGFQHVVANMFVIPAGIFAGADVTWGEFVANLVPAFLGNVVGGAIFVGLAYYVAFQKKAAK
ncbi:formate/nitrite transporter family protein [Kurthia senegalensis]|uniref:formate/nitrite transporter family protein n=1 Tax=Kurthia senegalensis TaxID=1033740 RepID=UPI00028A2C1B|nr:formate/nitrite transporter family protein [Kurthia senegalensis]